jgi:hypothetical protein
MILDCLLVELRRRLSAYETLNRLFGFLNSMLSAEMTRSVLKEHAAKLVKAYSRNLDLSLEEELVQFNSVINTDLFQIDDSMELSMYRISPRTIYRLVFQK